MSRSIRAVMACVLAALLPFQGYAAAAMISCGPMHAHQLVMAGSAHSAGHSGHRHGADESAGEAETRSGETAPALPDLLKVKCSACAACCAGAAAPSPATPSVSATKPHAIVSTFFDWSDDSIVLPALERPPRALA